MANCTIPNMLNEMMQELMELYTTYGYMLQNAPTEEARRIVELNYRTVKMSMEKLKELYEPLTGEKYKQIGEYIEEVPIFANFMDAVRYAFIEETQVVQGAKDLYLMIDMCYHNDFFSILVEHELNALRLLYLSLF